MTADPSISIFQRRDAPSVAGLHYSAYRDEVREDFSRCCAFCLMSESLIGGPEAFDIDHFRPKSLFPEHEHEFLNLYHVCHVCNRYKGKSWPSPILMAKDARFVDACKELFTQHFASLARGEWEAKTQPGKYTAERLRLNRPHLIEIRRRMHECQVTKGSPGVNWDRPSGTAAEDLLGGCR